jgi:hypothetical protein
MAEVKNEAVVHGIDFRVRSSGRVKALDGFDKARHSVPDSVCPATTAFLARLCARELGDDAERLFQAARAALGYKRREMELSVGSPTALLRTPDFSLEWNYELNDLDASEWMLTKILSPSSGDIVRRPAFEGLFSGQFTDLVFTFSGAADIEAVIDAVEDLDAVSGLRVDYPSDCRECVLSVEGVSAHVKIEPASLRMAFPKNGSPAELLDGFVAVRDRFRLAKQGILAGLLG